VVVGAVVAAGGGDVGVSFPAECSHDEVADAGAGVGLAAGACFLCVLPERDIADVMLPVFDGPVLACVDGEVAGAGEIGGQAGDAVGDLLAGPRAAGGAGVAADAQDLGGVRPVDAVAMARREPPSPRPFTAGTARDNKMGAGRPRPASRP
jgi:hypothetical protein